MRLLETFRTHNIDAARAVIADDINVDVSIIGNIEPTAKCSVNVESPRLLGNLTMWVTGECDLLVTDETAETVLINETQRLRTASDVRRCIDDAYRRIRDINGGAI